MHNVHNAAYLTDVTVPAPWCISLYVQERKTAERIDVLFTVQGLGT